MSVAPQDAAAEYDAIELVSIASMTNNELFTKVIAAIKRSFRQRKSDIKDWQSVATQVASCAAKGHAGYRSPDDWVKQFHTLAGGNGDQKGAASARSSLGDALKALPAKDCYRTRLENAFTALKSSAPTSSDNVPKLTVKQAAGLIRSAAFLSAEVGDNDKDSTTAKIDCELQSSAISHLVRAMPQLATSSPCDIFLAVQLPLLQKIQWGAFAKGGIKFASADAEAEFKSLLNLDFGKQHDSSVQVGEKRKRVEEEIDDRIKNAYSTVLHLLEAAHLARNGSVRAQHGAVIYVGSGDSKTSSTVIGRGWNHDLLVERAKFNKNKLVLHSEAHAVADAIRTHGEDACFEEFFPNATIMIVELESDYTYDTAHPCPKCDPLLRAVGVANVQHTTADGSVAELKLSPPSLDFLSNENVAIPLEAACDEQKICCNRLQEAFDMKKYSK